MDKAAIRFMDDLPLLRGYIAERVRAQFGIGKPVSAIDVGFQLCQVGLVVFHFDTRQKHDRDGEWTSALEGPKLELPHWQAAFGSAGEKGASFVLLSGERRHLPPGAGDAAVAGVFGQTLLSVALDAVARGLFSALNLRDDCQLDIEEFNAMWWWPEYDDLGRTNLLRSLPAIRLPS